MSQFLNLLKSLPSESVLPMIQNLSPEVAEKLSSVIGKFPSSVEIGSSADPIINSISNTIQENAPVLADSIQSVGKVYKWRNFLVISIILWAIFLITSRIINPYPQIQENFEKTNDLLIGKSGIIQVIVSVWVSAILIVTLIPAILALTPKLEKLLEIVTLILQTVGLKN